MKKLPRQNSSREESFSQANSTFFLLHLQLHFTHKNIVTKGMDCCNSAVSALKEQLFFSGMQYVKRENGQLFVKPLFREFYQRRAAGGGILTWGRS
jgi:hypothetical protein